MTEAHIKNRENPQGYPEPIPPFGFDQKRIDKDFKKYEEGLLCVDSFFRGARHENSRLMPLIEQMADFIDAIETQLESEGHDQEEADGCALCAVLFKIRAWVESL